jgi:hypothetical protein
MASINFAQRLFAQSTGGLLLGLLLLFGGSVGATSANATESRAAPPQTRLIIQGRHLSSARAAVRDAGVRRVWADAQARLQVTPGLPQPD